MEKRKIIAVTSGKGGVGKSSIVSNMAYLLGKKNEKTYIFDADLSLGNIDIMFGIVPKHTIKDVMDGEREISDIIVEGPCGIRIIPATSGVMALSELSEQEQDRILAAFVGLPDYDFMFIDTSAGISSNVIYFNTISHDVYVVVTPDPASIADSYAIIKVLHKKQGRTEFNVIVNMVNSEEEALTVFRNLTNVADKFLEVYINFTGFIPMDSGISTAIRKRKLWAEVYPDSPAAKALQKVCEKVLLQ
jgi:flagellar biosynthesis protein FlhG